MVAVHIKKIKHSMLCVAGMCLRDTANTIFVILHLYVSRLSICSPCLGMIYVDDQEQCGMVVVVIRAYRFLMDVFLFVFMCRPSDWGGVLRGGGGSEMSRANRGHLDRHHR